MTDICTPSPLYLLRFRAMLKYFIAFELLRGLTYSLYDRLEIVTYFVHLTISLQSKITRCEQIWPEPGIMLLLSISGRVGPLIARSPADRGVRHWPSVNFSGHKK